MPMFSRSDIRRASTPHTQHGDPFWHICEVTNPGLNLRTSCFTQVCSNTHSHYHTHRLVVSLTAVPQKAVLCCPVWIWNSSSCLAHRTRDLKKKKKKVCSLEEKKKPTVSQVSKSRHQIVSQCMKQHRWFCWSHVNRPEPFLSTFYELEWK